MKGPGSMPGKRKMEYGKATKSADIVRHHLCSKEIDRVRSRNETCELARGFAKMGYLRQLGRDVPAGKFNSQKQKTSESIVVI